VSLTDRPVSRALADHREAAARARAILVALADSLGATEVYWAVKDMEAAAEDLERSADRLEEMLSERGEEEGE
jgi:hypothetical protein